MLHTIIAQVAEGANLLKQAEQQGFLVYLLCFLVLTLCAVIAFLFKRLEGRTDSIIRLYQEIAQNEQALRELSALIKEKNLDAMRDMMTRMEYERRIKQQ